jgi:hypothetical protein
MQHSALYFTLRLWWTRILFSIQRLYPLSDKDTKGWILEGLVILTLFYIPDSEHPSFRSEDQFGVIIKLNYENLHSHSLDDIISTSAEAFSSSSSGHFHTYG